MNRSLVLCIVLLVGWMVLSVFWYTCEIKGISNHSTKVDGPIALQNNQIYKKEVTISTFSEADSIELKDSNTNLSSKNTSNISEQTIENKANTTNDTGLNSIKIPKKVHIPCPTMNLNQSKPTISDILFDYNSSEIVCKAKLREFAQATKTYLSANVGSVIITGHTDEGNKSINNLALGLKRAISVKKLFIEEGISANRIATFSHGNIEPITINQTMSSRKVNRRVSIEFN